MIGFLRRGLVNRPLSLVTRAQELVKAPAFFSSTPASDDDSTAPAVFPSTPATKKDSAVPASAPAVFPSTPAMIYGGVSDADVSDVLDVMKKHGLSAQESRTVMKKFLQSVICYCKESMVEAIDQLVAELGLHGQELYSVLLSYPGLMWGLKPTARLKLRWMRKIGLSPHQICSMIFKCPVMLDRPIPALELIYDRLLLLHDQLPNEKDPQSKVRKLISEKPLILTVGKKFLVSLQLLEEAGVRSSDIIRLIEQKPLSFTTPKKIQDALEYARSFGLKMSLSNTFTVVKSFVALSDDLRKEKEEVYHTWGWNGEYFKKALSSNGNILSMGLENIHRTMTFLVHECQIDAKVIASDALLLNKSVEGTLIPRLRIYKFLGLGSSGMSLFYLLKIREIDFEQIIEKKSHMISKKNMDMLLTLLEEEEKGKKVKEENDVVPLVKMYRMLRAGFDKEQLIFTSD